MSLLLATFLALAQAAPAKPTSPAPSTPAQADPVQARLESSARHHEWIELPRGERKLRCFAVFPQEKAKVQAVLVIHENKGLSDWVRSVADRLAEAGYVALAPDLLSGAGPGGGGTSSFERTEAATQVIYSLDAKQVMADLDALFAHARTLPACNGKVSVAGFCWGGGKAFDYATQQPELAAAYVFYGSAPKETALFAGIRCPVYGFYAENDARITAEVGATAEAMAAAGKSFDREIYPGAGHGFLRAGEAADALPANKAAFEKAWERWKGLLAR